MPIIPVQKTQISTDVPGASTNPGNAGIVGEAYARLGSQIQNVSVGMLEQIKTTEAHNAVFQQENEDFLWHQDTSTKLKLNSQDGYMRDDRGEVVVDPVTNLGRTIDQEYRDRANERFQEASEKMPSALAQNLYNERQSKWFTGNIGSMASDVQIKKFTAMKESTTLRVQHMGDQFISTPSLDLRDFYSQGDSLWGRIQAGVGTEQDQTNADAMKREHLSYLAESNADGLIRKLFDDARSKKPGFNPESEARRILTILDGQDSASRSESRKGLYTLANALTEGQQDKLRRELLSITKSSKLESVSTYEEFVTGMNAKAERRGAVSIEQGLQQINAAAKVMIDQGSKTPEQIINDQANFIAHHVVGQINSESFALLPEREQLKVENGMNARIDKFIGAAISKDNPYRPAAGEVSKKIVREKLDDIVAKHAAQHKQDPAQFVTEYDSTLKKSKGILDYNKIETYGSAEFIKTLQRTESNQKMKNPLRGAADPLLSKEESQSFANVLRSPNTPDANKVATLDKLRTTNPKYYGRLMNQMIDDGALGFEWKLMTAFPSRRVTAEFVSTLSKFSPQMEKEHDEYLKSKSITSESFAAEARPILDPFVAAIQAEDPRSQNNVAMTNAVREFFYKKTKMILQDTGKSDVTAAAKDAYAALIGNNTEIIQMNRGGWFANENKQSYQMRFPKILPDGSPVLPTDQKYLNEWQDKNLTVDGLNAIKPDLPKNWGSTIDQKRFTETIAKKARLVPDSTDPAMLKIMYMTDFDKSPVALQKDGKTFKIPLKNILKYREKPTEGTLMKILKGMTFDHEFPSY